MLQVRCAGAKYAPGPFPQGGRFDASNGKVSLTVKATVLLPCFRGRSFIAEQIDSILKQQAVDLSLIVRDDGSDDGTAEIVGAIAASDSRVQLVEGRHLGVIAGVFALLEHGAVRDAPFVAFADQDDIWPVDRLARQAAALAALPAGEPGLCFGGFVRIDDAGRLLDDRPILPPLPDRGALLSENQVPGCTMMVNRAGCALVRASLPPPERIFMHDWWVEQVIAFTGTIVRVDEIVLHYRQHGGNLVGLPSPLGIWRDRFARIRDLRGRHPLLTQIEELDRRYGDRMSSADRARVQRFLRAAGGGWRERLAYAFSSDFRRARRSDDLFLRLLLLAGYFRTQPR